VNRTGAAGLRTLSERARRQSDETQLRSRAEKRQRPSAEAPGREDGEKLEKRGKRNTHSTSRQIKAKLETESMKALLLSFSHHSLFFCAFRLFTFFRAACQSSPLPASLSPRLAGAALPTPTATPAPMRKQIFLCPQRQQLCFESVAKALRSSN